MFTHLINLSGPTQAVEDRPRSEKRMGSKKLSGQVTLGCPVPDLRRRTSVATYTTWNSNDVRSLYNGTNNRSLRGIDNNVIRGDEGSVTRSSRTS